MKRIIVRAIKTKKILQTIDVKDEGVQDMCYKIAVNPEYGGAFIDYNFEISEISEKCMTAIQYLEETEWYFIRSLEVGIPTPKDVKKKREEAWETIKKDEKKQC